MPAQSLTYLLGPGAPAGATLDPANGLLTCPTTPTEGGTTKTFTVSVRDNGVPPRTTTMNFPVAVLPPLRTSITREGSLVRLSWDAQPGLLYCVRSKAMLSQPFWMNQTNPRQATTTRETVTLPIVGTTFFCQVVQCRPCPANDVTKTLKYSRGNNDADQLKKQFTETEKANGQGQGTYVYETATMEFTLGAKPACGCDANNECSGTIALTVDVKITEKTKCVEGKAPRWKFMNGVDATGASTVRNNANTPAPDVTTTAKEITYTNANTINTNTDPKIFTTMATDAVPCKPGTYDRRFVFTMAGAGDKETPGAAGLAAYLDVHVKVERDDVCKLKVSLTGEYLEYSVTLPPRFDWLTQCGGMVKDAVKELAPVTYKRGAVTKMNWNIAKLIEECGMKVDNPFPPMKP